MIDINFEDRRADAGACVKNETEQSSDEDYGVEQFTPRGMEPVKPNTVKKPEVIRKDN